MGSSDFAQSGTGTQTRVTLTPAGELPVEQQFNASWISQNITTVIPANLIHSVNINKSGLGGNSIQLFNGTVMANNVIGVIDTTVSGTHAHMYDTLVSGTLTVVTVSGICGDFTVSSI